MLLYVKVKPNQRSDKIERTSDGWQIRLKAQAVDGKANEHLISFLSSLLGLPKSGIQLKKGLTNRFKCLEIDCDEDRVFKVLEKESEK